MGERCPLAAQRLPIALECVALSRAVLMAGAGSVHSQSPVKAVTPGVPSGFAGEGGLARSEIRLGYLSPAVCDEPTYALLRSPRPLATPLASDSNKDCSSCSQWGWRLLLAVRCWWCTATKLSHSRGNHRATSRSLCSRRCRKDSHSCRSEERSSHRGNRSHSSRTGSRRYHRDSHRCRKDSHSCHMGSRSSHRGTHTRSRHTHRGNHNSHRDSHSHSYRRDSRKDSPARGQQGPRQGGGWRPPGRLPAVRCAFKYSFQGRGPSKARTA